MTRRKIPDAHRIRKTLRETFGYTALRPGQEAVIASVLEGRDTLAIMPTGAGKSLCYQLPALHLPGTTLVISPLISLMKDQAGKLDDAGIAAAQMNSTLTETDERAELRRIARARREIVFATPERLASPQFLEALKHNAIDLFVIDEAHCISQWGHDFRPAFLEIGGAIAALGNPPVLALTATATDAVVEDIRAQLGRRGMRVIHTGVYRENLRYQVTHVTNEGEKLARLRKVLQEEAGSGIVYCATVKSANAVYEALKADGERVARYHGRLGARERRENQDGFMSGACRVMVATNAFGLGIDKPDIRFILHYQMPGSVEAYYQESGRAGRDGKPALCDLLYDLRDRRVQQFFLGGRYPAREDIERICAALGASMPHGATLAELRTRLPDVAGNKLRVALKLLKDGRMVEEQPDRRYRMAGNIARSERTAALADAYRERSEADREKLERMVFYAQTASCRWKVVLDYFGEDTQLERCGVCDNCVRPPAERYSSPQADNARIRARRRKTPAFEPGAEVVVPRYGAGRVVSNAAGQVEVVFPGGQTRVFLSSYVHQQPAS